MQLAAELAALEPSPPPSVEGLQAVVAGAAVVAGSSGMTVRLDDSGALVELRFAHGGVSWANATRPLAQLRCERATALPPSSAAPPTTFSRCVQ